MLQTYTGAAVYTEQDKFVKVPFSDIDKGKTPYAKSADNGWVAMVQHYFVSALLPPDKTPREYYTEKISDDFYRAGVKIPLAEIPAGGTATAAARLYVGPEEQDKLKAVAAGLDLVVDYGWLTVIAAPLFWMLELFHKWLGNWGLAIIALTVLIKLVFFPLSAASYKSMARMKQVTPRLMKLRETYGDDRAKLNQAMMELYKQEKINPLGGCLPIVVQIPVFIALYWVLLASVELRQAPFYGWIKDLSVPDPFFILPALMMGSMVIQTKMSPTPPDPVQAKVMQIMPFAFGVMFFFFPAGLVLYWLVNNILSIAQQWQITRMIEGGKKAAARQELMRRPRPHAWRRPPTLSRQSQRPTAAPASASSGFRAGRSPAFARDLIGTVPPARRADARGVPRRARRGDRRRPRALFSRARTLTPARTCSSCTATAARSCWRCCCAVASSSGRASPSRASSRAAPSSTTSSTSPKPKRSPT